MSGCTPQRVDGLPPHVTEGPVETPSNGRRLRARCRGGRLRRRRGRLVLAGTGLRAAAKAVAPFPFAYPDGLAPVPRPLATPPASDAPMPAADVLVVTWTAAEKMALADTFTRGGRGRLVAVVSRRTDPLIAADQARAPALAVGGSPAGSTRGSATSRWRASSPSCTSTRTASRPAPAPRRSRSPGSSSRCTTRSSPSS